MAQDETNVDTPEQGSNLSVEDAFFSPEEGTTTTDATETVAQVVSEDVSTPTQPTIENNDERRYQYWQSEADKVKNENEALKGQLQTQAMQAQAVQAQQAQQAPAQNEQQAEAFPPPPNRPGKPAGYDRADAYNDPTSPSARYLDEVDAWRDNMTEYTQIKSDYDTSVVQEKMHHQETQRVENIKRAQAQQQMNQQVNGIYNQVQGEYGLNADEAKSFVNQMSKPDSLSMDNLVELWRMKSGSGAQVNTQPAQPSPTFNQQARAQQVASPMGVLPAQQSNDTSSEDSIIDSMISGYNKNNPW